MNASWRPSRLFKRCLFVYLLFSAYLGFLYSSSRKHNVFCTEAELEQKYPLLYQHVHNFNGTGGGTLRILATLASYEETRGFLFEALPCSVIRGHLTFVEFSMAHPGRVALFADSTTHDRRGSKDRFRRCQYREGS